MAERDQEHGGGQDRFYMVSEHAAQRFDMAGADEDTRFRVGESHSFREGEVVRADDLPSVPGRPTYEGLGVTGDFEISSVFLGVPDVKVAALNSEDEQLLAELDAVPAPPASSALDGSYLAYLYKITYRYDGGIYRTYMRIYAPTMLAADSAEVDVVLAVDGGTKESVCISASQQNDDMYELMATLASGASYDDEVFPSASQGTALPKFRSGEPMFAIGFIQPGRGQQGDIQADGDPAMPPTPLNITGMDYCGEMTVKAMDAVMCLATTIIGQMLERAVPNPRSALEYSLRLMVCSQSNGLTAASHWIAQTDFAVAALVDWEGPSAGSEQDLVVRETNPLRASFQNDKRLAATLPVNPNSYPEALNFAVWENYLGDGWDDYFFRPPPEILDEIEGLGANDLPIAGGTSASYSPMWSDWYGDPKMDLTAFVDEMREFWADREAETLLSNLGEFVYIRIQRWEDHAQSAHLYNRHAVRALNAAYEGPAQVYYTDDSYYHEVILDGGENAPAKMDAPWVREEDWSDEEYKTVGTLDLVRDYWPEWGDVRFESPDYWAVQVDLIRWFSQGLPLRLELPVVGALRNVDAELMARWVELLHTQAMVLEAHGAQVWAEIRRALDLLFEERPTALSLLKEQARNARDLASSLNELVGLIEQANDSALDEIP